MVGVGLCRWCGWYSEVLVVVGGKGECTGERGVGPPAVEGVAPLESKSKGEVKEEELTGDGAPCCLVIDDSALTGVGLGVGASPAV